MRDVLFRLLFSMILGLCASIVIGLICWGLGGEIYWFTLLSPFALITTYAYFKFKDGSKNE